MTLDYLLMCGVDFVNTTILSVIVSILYSECQYDVDSFRFLVLSFHCSPLMILGVTNPFFTKTLEHWPHIVRIGELGSKGHG